MATYVNDLRLKEIGTGESSGTWGTETNVNLELIGEALGYGTEGITTNADTHTTTVADGSTDPGRAMYIEYTGTLDSACTITIAPNTLSRLHYIENGTSGSQNIIIKQGSGATVTIPPGDTKAVYLDGAGSGAKVVDVFASFSVVDLKVQDDLTVTDDVAIGGLATVGGTLGVTGILTCTDDIIIGDGKTIGSASDVDAMTIAANGQVTFTQTLIGTALDISGDIDVDGTTNLDVVDIDGAVDMATTLAVAGNVDFNGALDVDGTTNLDVVDIDGAVDMASTLQVDGVITTSDGMVITTADNTDTLSLISTDADAFVGPNLRFYRNSSSPADADMLAALDFEGRNDNSQDVLYAQILTQTSDVSDGTEDGTMYIQGMVAGTIRAKMSMFAGETVINDAGIDLDFRVESDGNANMLFVDGGKNSVGIGTTPEAHYTGYVGLDIGNTLSLFSNNTSTNVSTLTNNGFLNADASNWVRKVTDEATMYSQVSGDHRFSTAASGSAGAAITWSETVRFQGAGGISFNGDTAAANALDDYEEGTWTPTWTNGIGNGSTSGTYVKVGNIVHVTALYTMGSTTSIGAKLEATNLPFTASQTTYSGSRYENYQSNSYIGATRASAAQLRGYIINVAGTQATELLASTNAPFTWGENDYAQLAVTYTTG